MSIAAGSHHWRPIVIGRRRVLGIYICSSVVSLLDKAVMPLNLILSSSGNRRSAIRR